MTGDSLGDKLNAEHRGYSETLKYNFYLHNKV
jgi:hypothetical protein